MQLFAEGSKGKDWVLLLVVFYPSNSKRDPAMRWLILPCIESFVICMKLTKNPEIMALEEKTAAV